MKISRKDRTTRHISSWAILIAGKKGWLKRSNVKKVRFVARARKTSGEVWDYGDI